MDIILTEGDDNRLLIRNGAPVSPALVVYALGGNDTIKFGYDSGGWAYDFVAYGGAGNDVIDAGSAIRDLGGTIYGEDGNDFLKGGAGDSSFAYGATYIDGGAGDDILIGLSSFDTLLGGDGNDWIRSAGTGRAVLGGSGNDTIFYSYAARVDNLDAYGGTGADFIYGSDQNDILSGDEGIDLLVGRGGNDYLYLNADGGTAYGNEGNDVGVGAADADNFIMGDGNDAAYGYGGRDYLLGEGGNDTLIAGDGNDVIYGGAGINFMYGDGGDDVFIAEGSADQMEGGSGHNYYYRYGAGTSYSTGGAGIDEFIGDAFASNDTVVGGAGNDYLYGGGGNDLLQGGADNDVILGQAGNDTLEGGAGVNLLWANDAGNDQILVNVADGGTQVVEFFEAGGTNDVVRLLGSNLTSFTGIQNLINNISTLQNGNFLTNAGSGAQLILGLGTATQTAIWFQGVSAYSLTAADFLFG
jgi:Ca2+-binding RTX toxin-like protein